MIAKDFRIITNEKDVLQLQGGDDCIWLEDVSNGTSTKLTFEEARELAQCLTEMLA